MTAEKKVKPPTKRRDNRSLLARYAAAPHMVWAVLFIIAPLIFVTYYAFTSDVVNETGEIVRTFSLENFISVFSLEYIAIFLRSIRYSIIATVICLLIGYPVAYFISRAKPKTQKLLIMLLMLPMWMNFIIRTYAISVIIQDEGVINSFLREVFKLINLEAYAPQIGIFGKAPAVILGMVYDYLPYMILPIYSVMAKLDYRLVEAAGDLGCNGLGVLGRVILPLSISGVVSGVTMVFVPCISTFYISQKLGSIDTILIGDIIEQRYAAIDYGMTAALSFVLMMILIIGLAVVNKYTDKDEAGGMLP